MTNHLLEAALEYARQGWAVFPCNASKEPLVPNGVMDATTNVATLEQWWAKWPRANIGFNVGEAEMMVLDLDPGHDKVALSAFVGGLPDTPLRARTPRGGEHLYYDLMPGEVVSPSASKLGEHVDVRSFHSYVLLPPSRTADGDYTWESKGEPTYRTDEMVRLSNSHREKSGDRDNWIIEPDLPENVADAIAWLKAEAKIAVEGVNGDHMAYATAAHLHSFGISQERAFELMWEHWNPRCTPPWGPDEVEHVETKIANAYENYCTSPPGNITKAYRAAKDAQLFRPVARLAIPEGAPGREVIRGRFRFVDRAALKYIPKPKWLIEGVLMTDTYAMLVAEQSSFKTFAAIDMGLSIATGGTCIDPVWQANEGGNVLMAVGEGRGGLEQRVHAWEAKHNLGNQVPNFILQDPVPNVLEEWDDFFGGALEMCPSGYKFVIIDTVGRAMAGANENSQETASRFTVLVDTIRRHLGATVLAIHHSGHGDKARAKGSMEFLGAPDTILTLARPSLGSLGATMTMVKQKDAPEWEKPKQLSFEEMVLPDGGKSLSSTPHIRTDVIEAGTKAIQESHRKRKNVGQPTDDAVRLVYDTAVIDELAKNKSASLSQATLAAVLAKRDEIQIGYDAIVKQLAEMKHQSQYYTGQAYDPRRKVWRYFEPS